MARWLVVARAVLLEVNVLLLDTDTTVLQDVYKFVKAEPFSRATLLFAHEPQIIPGRCRLECRKFANSRAYRVSCFGVSSVFGGCHVVTSLYFSNGCLSGRSQYQLEPSNVSRIEI